MAFIARVEKPCNYCGVKIPKGTAEGFTWDRTNGGFIHSECIRRRKVEPQPGGAQPKTRYCGGVGCVVILSDDEVDYCGAHKALKAIPLPAPAKNEGVITDVTPKGYGPDPLGGVEYAPTGTITKRKGSNGADADTAHELAKLIQSLAGARGIDEAAVRKIAADEAAKVSVNRSITIQVDEAPEIKLDLAHRDLPLLVKLVSAYGANGHRQNIYMHGPAGSGKSTAARQASEVMKLPYGYISLNPQTPDSRLLGYMHAGGEYVKSEFFVRYTQGGVFCIDEIDNASASLVTTLNGLLENGHGAFPHGVFERHKDFVCVCTANTIGRGGDVNYPERRQLDGAFLERFIFLAWEYDDDLTKAIVTGILGNRAPEFMSWIKSEARDLQARFPTLIVSPRAYIQGAALEKLGLSRNQIRPMVVSRGLK